MKTPHSRKKRKTNKAFHVETLGRVRVPVYKRKTPSGTANFMVANYSGEKRRFDSYPTEALAIEAAGKLAKRLSERDTVAATMTNDQAIEYAGGKQSLAPYGVTVGAACAVIAQTLKDGFELSSVPEALKLYRASHKAVTNKPIASVIVELRAVKETRTKRGRPASARYLGDLKNRLNRFETDFKRDLCNVTASEIQQWLDGLKLEPQGYKNFRSVLNTLFEFGVRRGYANSNPVKDVEKIERTHGEIQIYSPDEMARLLASAQANQPDFVPILALGGFAGIRSAELLRLEWSNVDLAARHIKLDAGITKTASNRFVPISENLLAWLQPYAAKKGKKKGKIWTLKGLGKIQKAVTQGTASKGKAPVKWKHNALRHSYGSYRSAELGDAAKVASEMGNSEAVIHAHYRKCVKPADSQKWFSIMPEAPSNVVTLASQNNPSTALDAQKALA